MPSACRPGAQHGYLGEHRVVTGWPVISKPRGGTSFISQQCQAAGQHTFTTSADPCNLQGKQLQVYTIVQQHCSIMTPWPLRMIVSGMAGTGKSYLIHCLRLLLQHQLVVPAPTGVAAFNIDGHTLHSLPMAKAPQPTHERRVEGPGGRATDQAAAVFLGGQIPHN